MNFIVNDILLSIILNKVYLKKFYLFKTEIKLIKYLLKMINSLNNSNSQFN